MKPTLFWTLLLGFLSACAAEAPNLIVQSYPFDPSGKSILIQHFAFYPETATGVNQEAVQGLGELLALDIQRYLKDAGFRLPLVITPGEQNEGDILIRGSITRVWGGDVRHRRSFDVFGFGATDVRVRGEVVDLKTNQSLVGFFLSQQSPYSPLENEAAVRENIKEIAREIASVLMQSRKK